MGMSHDFEVAIEEGATCVRVGTAVFGKRAKLRELSAMVTIHNSTSGVTFGIKLHPRAKKNAITGEVGDVLKISLTAPPVDGKANQACIDF